MKHLFLIAFIGISGFLNAQESLSELLKRFNKESIPYISVQELAMPKSDAILLDARELSEYTTSHIKNAIHVGYNTFNIETVKETIPNTSKVIVVYCSLGIRSEAIANKLKSEGYSNVFNLYGGIFEWKNNGFKVYDTNGKETEKIDAFSAYWSQWLHKGEKVFSVKDEKSNN